MGFVHIVMDVDGAHFRQRDVHIRECFQDIIRSENDLSERWSKILEESARFAHTRRVVRRIDDLINRCDDAGIPTIIVQFRHFETILQNAEGKTVVVKKEWDAFDGTDLADVLEQYDCRDGIIMTGGYLGCCISDTIRSRFAPKGLRYVVPYEYAFDGHNHDFHESHPNVLKGMRAAGCKFVDRKILGLMTGVQAIDSNLFPRRSAFEDGILNWLDQMDLTIYPEELRAA